MGSTDKFQISCRGDHWSSAYKRRETTLLRESSPRPTSRHKISLQNEDLRAQTQNRETISASRGFQKGCFPFARGDSKGETSSLPFSASLVRFYAHRNEQPIPLYHKTKSGYALSAHNLTPSNLMCFIIRYFVPLPFFVKKGTKNFYKAHFALWQVKSPPIPHRLCGFSFIITLLRTFATFEKASSAKSHCLLL